MSKSESESMDETATIDPSGFADDMDMDSNIDMDMAGQPEPRQSRAERIKNMLWQTQPDTPLEEVESPFDPKIGGLNRVYRGIQKISGADGVPAIWDIVAGIGEYVYSLQQSPEKQQAESPNPDTEAEDIPIE